MSKKAVVLLSGGLDSTVATYVTRSEGYEVHALTIVYGQLHTNEIEKAKKTADALSLEHHIVRLDLPWKGSALLDQSIPVPDHREDGESDIPVTYVPGRNIIFLSYALSWAEVCGAEIIVIGANQLDYSGYPDCRESFFSAMQTAFTEGTKVGVEGNPVRIVTPLLHKTKKDIVLRGTQLHVPFEDTWSCYKGMPSPCGVCDACMLRARGFSAAGVEDPLGR